VIRLPDPYRILIVDDHPIARCGLREMLREEPSVEVVGEASSGMDALTQLLKGGIDLLLLDMVLPELDGLEVLREVRRRFPMTKVLIVSALDQGYAIRDAIKAKADGYIPKMAHREEVISAIQHVMLGGLYIHPSLSEAFHEGMSSEPQLTERQRAVLERLSGGLSNKEIAIELGLQPETVKSHVKEILRRMGCRDRTSAVAKALQEHLI
jgi:DNA-binding NarL/FixJ family response regulator